MTAKERVEHKKEVRRLCKKHNIIVLEIPEATRIQAIKDANVTSYFDPNAEFKNGVPIKGDGWIDGTPEEIVKHMDWPYVIMTSTDYVPEPFPTLPAPKTPMEWIIRQLTIPAAKNERIKESPARCYSYGTARAFDHKVSDLRFLISLLFKSGLAKQLRKLKKEKTQKYQFTIDKIMKCLDDLQTGVDDKWKIAENVRKTFVSAMSSIFGVTTAEEHAEAIDKLEKTMLLYIIAVMIIFNILNA